MIFMMGQELIFVINSLVDMACISSISDDAIVGATFAMTICGLMYNIYSAFSKAARVLVAKYYGAEDEYNMKATLSATTILDVGVAVILALIMGIWGSKLLGLFSLTDLQHEYAINYIYARLPGFLIFSATSPIARCIEGRSQIARLVKVRSCNLLNGPISILLMQSMGVIGVGLGTSVTEFIELLIMLIIFRPKYSKPTKHNFVEVFNLGCSYLPESLLNPVTNTIMSNLCLIYLGTAEIVIMQLANKLYDNILDIQYASTQYAELSVGHEYGAGNQNGIVSEFKLFRHCYVRLLLLHVPITFIVGFIYLGWIINVENLVLAFVLLGVRIIAEIPYYIELPARRLLYIFNVVKPVVAVKIVSLVVIKLVVLYLALMLGAGSYSLAICYFASNLPCAIINLILIIKGKYLRPIKESENLA